jgi:hypothetical protein
VPETINFYRASGTYGCFSNFYRRPVKIGGKMWPTTEHFFQAMKFMEAEHQEAIREAKSPMDAAKMGRDRKRPLRADWEEIKDDIMYSAVVIKFCQHDDLREILLATGDAVLIEHTVNDSYWGDGGDGTGKNMLGQILMKARAELAQS